MSELIPVMKRELPRRPPTPENVLEFFLSRVRQNLHIALCFSPVGGKVRRLAHNNENHFARNRFQA